MEKDIVEQSCCLETGQSLNRMPFKTVMDCLSTSELERAYQICSQHGFRPKLGQLLIASGRLSAPDLDAMLVVHEHEKIKDVPMGKLLVIAGLLTGEELNRYFELQKLLQSPVPVQAAEARVDAVVE